MTAEELGEIIARGENLRVEFKSDRDKLPDTRRHKPGYEKSDAFGVTVVMPKEKADFAFLDMVNEYEKKTGKEMKVDALLTVAELKERGKFSFNEIVALTQRKPETIRGDRRVDCRWSDWQVREMA